jgi:two-component system, sensor histidine kinase
MVSPSRPSPLPPQPGAAGALAAHDIDAQALAARAAMLFRRARLSSAVAVPFGVLLCWVLAGAVHDAVLAVWFALLVLTVGWREWLFRRFARQPAAVASRWDTEHVLAIGANGTVLGLIGTLLMPSNDPATGAIMLATVVAIAAVGLVVLSSRFAAALAMCLPVLVPTIVMQLAQGTRLSTYTGLAMCIFLLLVVIEGRQAARHTFATLRQRFRMDELAAQRQQALELAERSNAVKTQFLATMSHEMRTPLHGILGLTRMLQSSPGADANRASRLELIERTGEHLLGLINDVLDHSKIDGGHLRLEPAPVNLAALIESVADLTRVGAAEKQLELDVRTDPGIPTWVLVDGPRLRQVMLNLLGNAVKFTETGSVRLSVHADAAGHTRFEVTDSGPGVPAKEREAIFDAFHQADGSFGRRYGGTGLGLTISREIARAMGGNLTCEDSPQGGARFVLTLPLAPTERVVTTYAPLEAPQRAELRGHVLLAEDNPVSALVAETMLQQAGLKVDVVDNGHDAVTHTAANAYDLVLMDCQMPGMDGFVATAQIRQREQATSTRRVPIVALTANALDSDRQRCIEVGMDDHLAKPFREEALAELLQRYVATR